MLTLNEHLRQCLPAGREFEAVMSMPGQEFRRQKNRRTFRAELDGRGYFVKVHGTTSWPEILKNALRGRWPVLSARSEWRAIQRLESLGIPTIRACGFGERGRAPDKLESFIITQELQGAVHLSDLPARLEHLPPRRRSQLIRAFTTRLADIARRLHAAGLNHRDFYLCHFMVRDRDWSRWAPGDELTVHVIDLHRMQIRRRTPLRWAVKDVSGLLFSALDAGISGRDCLRFVRVYWGDSWKQRWRRAGLWRGWVVRRAVSLYRSEHGRSPQLPAGLASSA